ncbi:HAD-IA family hydrolase [Bowmanella dokdonensis]|uniref:HAD-IA family hydrolase n=2 Tax=Bowmanella dokdonensis TaxID=751969 RepID=A0A939IQI5_9ALTE|nr:HAD-IA family hydrolase [Bowmanella dokdonensis]
MTKKYSLVIFDWDGTLMDSCGRIVSSMQTAARRAGLAVPSNEAVKDIIGISLKPAISRLFGQLESYEADTLFEYYRQEYVEKDLTPTPLFAGAQALLADLRGRNTLMAVATGKARRGLDRVWRETGTGQYFSASRCGDETQSKPHPEMLVQLLDEFNLSAREAVMIGDTVYDMQMAEQLGMDRIGISHGVHVPERLKQHQPLAIVDSLAELTDWL